MGYSPVPYIIANQSHAKRRGGDKETTDARRGVGRFSAANQSSSAFASRTCSPRIISDAYFLSAAWAAARRAIGTRNGEQLT